MKVLITCPPMLGTKEEFLSTFDENDIEVFCPQVVQTMSENELINLLPDFDGWIIGDDPATRTVFEAGKRGNLKAAVKWGVGVDNVDFGACSELGIPIENTPCMFGPEVADIAIGYIIGLARETFFIDREIRTGTWPKSRGISVGSKTMGLVGYGDIGKNVATRARALGMNLIVYDPHVSGERMHSVEFAKWPESISECDFLVFTCALTAENRHMLNRQVFEQCKTGVRVVNVARGPLICESELLEFMAKGIVHSAALDVFEDEPLPPDSQLRNYPLCIFGSHNASNTREAVTRTNLVAIEKLLGFLEVYR